jgi:hypothetical protein
MAYIFSYYAISLACTGSIYNYVLVGMFGELSGFFPAIIYCTYCGSLAIGSCRLISLCC